MIEPKDKKELNERIKAGRMMLDMMESLVEKLERGGDSSDEEEKDEKEEGKKCEGCGTVHDTDDETDKIQAKVHEVLRGKGGMLSIIEASPTKERSAGQPMGIFLSRNMDRGSITNSTINLVQQVFRRLAKDLSIEKKKEFKRMIIEALEDTI